MVVILGKAQDVPGDWIGRRYGKKLPDRWPDDGRPGPSPRDGRAAAPCDRAAARCAPDGARHRRRRAGMTRLRDFLLEPPAPSREMPRGEPAAALGREMPRAEPAAARSRQMPRGEPAAATAPGGRPFLETLRAVFFGERSAPGAATPSAAAALAPAVTQCDRVITWGELMSEFGCIGRPERAREQKQSNQCAQFFE